MARLYDRPDLDQRRRQLALYITGSLPTAKPALAYEGRLQIHNAIGACTVEQIDGDALPPGHALYVDQATKEVVITWPEYSETATPITNPGFESGMSGWVAGAGWDVTGDNPISGTLSARFANTPGRSVISSTARYPVVAGREINAQCRVRQGASSAGNAGAGLLLEFRNAAGAVVETKPGNEVMSASNNAVYPSNVNALPPDGSATVNVAAVGIRNRENKPVWIDEFSWDHVAASGINADAVLNLTLRVRDSAGRSVLWQGKISVQARPTVYRAMIRPSATGVRGITYAPATATISQLTPWDVPGGGTTYGLGMSKDAKNAIVGHNISPYASMLAVDPALNLSLVANIPAALPGIGRVAAYSPSGAAAIIGHDAGSRITAYRTTPTGWGARYADPAVLPPAGVNSIVFSSAGDAVFLVSSTYPFLTAYRWSDADGFGVPLTVPVTGELPGSAPSAMALNESGTRIAVVCGSTPACHVYRVSSSGFGSRVSAVGGSGNGNNVVISDAAKLIAFGRSFGVQNNFFRWDGDTAGASYPAPSPLPSGVINACATSKDGSVLYIGTGANQSLCVYEWKPGVGATSAAPIVGAVGTGSIIAID